MGYESIFMHNNLDNTNNCLIIRQFGPVEYEPIYQAMQQFTNTRQPDTPDELWILQHFPVYTLGMAGKREHLLNTGNIPIVSIDRGGQVTYHGLGQLIFYTLMDIKRRQWAVKKLVQTLEQVVIDFLKQYEILAHRREHAPGVYVADAKIAALGLRVRRGCSYHGLSLNVDMDLTPFFGINPCGYPGLAVTQLKELGITDDLNTITKKLIDCMVKNLEYHTILHLTQTNK